MGVLRFFFAASVMFTHLQMSVGIPAIYAVQGFYVISGFYISLVLNEKYNTKNLTMTFYKKRLVRLLPTYWVVAALAMVLALCYYRSGTSSILFFDMQHYPDNATAGTTLFVVLSNIFIWGENLALFLAVSPDTGNLFLTPASFAEQYPLLRFMSIPVAWSVSTELSFYLIAPFILRGRKRLAIFLFVLSLLSNVVVNCLGLNDSNWRFRFFPSTLMYFLTGYFAYLLYRRHPQLSSFAKFRFVITAVAIVSLMCVLNLSIPYSVHTMFLLGVLFLVLPILFATHKGDRRDQAIGELTYPLYLMHSLFIGAGELLGVHNSLFVVVGSLCGSYLCYRYLVIPIEKFRRSI